MINSIKFINDCSNLCDLIEELPESFESSADEAIIRITNMSRWAEANYHATKKMQYSIARIREDVQAWLEISSETMT